MCSRARAREEVQDHRIWLVGDEETAERLLPRRGSSGTEIDAGEKTARSDEPYSKIVGGRSPLRERNLSTRLRVHAFSKDGAILRSSR